MAAGAPRSSSMLWGSLNALDQRVVRSPSVAYDAAVPAFSADVPVATAPRARLTGASFALDSDGIAIAAAAATAATTTLLLKESPLRGRTTGELRSAESALSSAYDRRRCLSEGLSPHDADQSAAVSGVTLCLEPFHGEAL